jgi:hypothetical protein
MNKILVFRTTAEQRHSIREGFLQAGDQEVAPDAPCLGDHPVSGAPRRSERDGVFQHPARLIVALALFLIPLLVSGCVTYQLRGGVKGGDISYPSDRLVVGKTTLGEVLVLLGAPDKVGRVDEGDLLIYQRAVLKRNQLSVGMPLADIWRLGIDLSAYGALVRYDRLVLLFTPEGILSGAAFEKSSDHPYWKAMTSNS